MAIPLDTRPEPAPTRLPGDFARHPHNGAPFVADPERTSKPKGTKAELLAQCDARGITVPAKVTVAELHGLLGPRPSMVMYGRPSSLGKIIEDATNLQKWAERAVALGLYLDEGQENLLSRLDGLDPGQLNLDDPDARVVLDEVATIAKQVARTGLAAERGTHHHAVTEDSDEGRDWIARAEAGEELGVPVAAQAALVEAWRAFVAEHFEVLAVEASVVDDRWRQAGTLDRIARLRHDMAFTVAGGEIVTLPAGWVGILDIKTGRLRVGTDAHPDYWQGYAVQIASYAQAVPYDTATDTRGTWPWEIDQRWGIIAHLDVLAALDGAAVCRAVLVDLEAGRQAGDLCTAAKAWGRRRDVFSLVTGSHDVVVPVEIAGEAARPPATASPAPDAAQPQPAQPADDVTNAPAGQLTTTPADPAAGEAEAAPTHAASPPASPAAPDDAAERAALRDRLARMRSSASNTGWRPQFEAELAAHRLSRASTVAEIKAALDAIEPPFDPAPPSPEAVAIVCGPAGCQRIGLPVREDAQASDDEIEAVVDAVRSSNRIDVVNGWVAEGGWSPRAKRTQRNVAIAWAALRLAEYLWDDGEGTEPDQYVRLVLALVVGDAALQPTVPVGATLGALTTAEARRVHALAMAAADGVTPLQFDAEGQPFLGGDVAAVLAAA